MDLHDILNNLDKGEKTEPAHLLHRELNVPDLNLISKDVGNDRPVRCPQLRSGGYLWPWHVQGPQAL